MFPARVYLLPETDTKDAAASVAEGFPPTDGLTALPCRVRLKGSHAGMAANQEIGITLADLAFPADPGCVKGDRFQQIGSGNRTFRALAPAQARDAGSVLFVVACEVID